MRFSYVVGLLVASLAVAAPPRDSALVAGLEAEVRPLEKRVSNRLHHLQRSNLS
jgi:hypothetical protein